jgi:hypothetical protein
VSLSLKITKKDGTTSRSFCTKAGNSPYNNNGVLAWVPSDRIVDEYTYRDARLVILRPVIDKLAFEYNFSDCGSHKREIREAVLKNAGKLHDKQGIPFSAATKGNVGGRRLHFLQKYYMHNFVLHYEATGAKVIIQLEAKKKGAAYMRCDLNPARLGAAGMAFFRDFLKLMLSNELKDLTFETVGRRAKAIKRIDIAVDLLGVDASDLEGDYIDKDKKLKKHPVQNPTGRVETMYFKMPENDKNSASWYNKRQELKDNAKDPMHGGLQSPYGHALYTRFEYRIQETDKPIANLKSLFNHLKKVRFRAIDYSRIDGMDYTHALFLRYALTRTRDKALAMIPDDLQAEYAASYDKAIVDIWKPEKIWEKGWHKELLHLGLTTPEELKKMKKAKKK